MGLLCCLPCWVADDRPSTPCPGRSLRAHNKTLSCRTLALTTTTRRRRWMWRRQGPCPAAPSGRCAWRRRGRPWALACRPCARLYAGTPCHASTPSRLPPRPFSVSMPRRHDVGHCDEAASSRCRKRLRSTRSFQSFHSHMRRDEAAIGSAGSVVKRGPPHAPAPVVACRHVDAAGSRCGSGIRSSSIRSSDCNGCWHATRMDVLMAF